MSGSILPLIVFALVATLTPGGATTLATASGARFGFRRSVPLMAGIAAALASLAAAAAAGLAGVLLAAPSLQLAMKLTGSAYLLWLAWTVGRAGPPAPKAGAETPTGFVAGACLLWLNPKGWAMALGAAAALSLSLWCLAGLRLARLLRSERQWRVVNLVLGLLLAASVIPMWLR
jgi:threonine/homoserine/homoserine lactone efflux protein